MSDTENQNPSPHKHEKLAERHGFFDFDKIEDPEVRQEAMDRFNSLYGSQKEDRAALEQMQNLYSGMAQKLAAMEAEKAAQAEKAELARTKKGIADANAKGDYERAADLTEKMADLKAPKAESNNDLTSAEHAALAQWQATLTDDGRVARPWATSGSPKYRETIAALTQAYADPAIRSRGFQAVLDEVDQKMAPAPKKGSPVVQSDATPQRETNSSTKLSPQQIRAAQRMYPPHVLKRIGEKDPIAAYQKAQKKYGSTP